MKSVFARIFATWAIIIFILTLLPVLIPMWFIGLVGEPKRTKIFRQISVVWMKVFFALTGCTLKRVGLENFHENQNYIVTCNHNSLMDVPITTPFIPGGNKTIAKVEMTKTPLFGLVYKRGSVLVDRNDKDSRKNSFKKMKEVLSMGLHMCIYPEGTRNKSNLPLKAFYDGAFKLAVDTGKSILPALIFNTKKVLPADKTFYFWPSKMELHFLPEIKVNKGEDFEKLREKVFNVMQEYYINHFANGMQKQ